MFFAGNPAGGKFTHRLPKVLTCFSQNAKAHAKLCKSCAHQGKFRCAFI
jgi:hypothetical protein